MIACDLGSNTIRFVEIDCKTRERIKEFEKIVKTAEILSSKGIISTSAIERIISAINEAKDIFDFSKGIYAVATEAIRKAKNGKNVIEQIFKQTGLKIEIISGDRELFYTNYAVKKICKVDDYILVDIGGGSTEVSFVNKDKIVGKSFELGIVTIVEKYGLENLYKEIDNKSYEIKEFFKNYHIPKNFIATAGTPTTIAAYIKKMDYNNYNYKEINNTILTKKEILRVKEELLKMDTDERVKWVGVGREDLIIAGIDIFLSLLELFDFESCVVVDEGLREGVALYRCDKS